MNTPTTPPIIPPVTEPPSISITHLPEREVEGHDSYTGKVYRVRSSDYMTAQELYAACSALQAQLSSENPGVIFAGERLTSDAKIGHARFRRGVRKEQALTFAYTAAKLAENAITQQIPTVYYSGMEQMAEQLLKTGGVDHPQQFWTDFLKRVTDAFVDSLGTAPSSVMLEKMGSLHSAALTVFYHHNPDALSNPAYWAQAFLSATPSETPPAERPKVPDLSPESTDPNDRVEYLPVRHELISNLEWVLSKQGPVADVPELKNAMLSIIKSTEPMCVFTAAQVKRSASQLNLIKIFLGNIGLSPELAASQLIEALELDPHFR